VQQCLFAEWQQVQLHGGREVAGAPREVGAAEGGGRPDGRHQVGHQRDVQHLVDGDAAQRRAPPTDDRGLLLGELVVGLETELGEQVLAHEHVFELSCLGQQEPQMLSVRDDDLGLGHVTIMVSRLLDYKLARPTGGAR
jgi:hypothetical protein